MLASVVGPLNTRPRLSCSNLTLNVSVLKLCFLQTTPYSCWWPFVMPLCVWIKDVCIMDSRPPPPPAVWVSPTGALIYYAGAEFGTGVCCDRGIEVLPNTMASNHFTAKHPSVRDISADLLILPCHPWDLLKDLRCHLTSTLTSQIQALPVVLSAVVQNVVMSWWGLCADVCVGRIYNISRPAVCSAFISFMYNSDRRCCSR